MTILDMIASASSDQYWPTSSVVRLFLIEVLKDLGFNEKEIEESNNYQYIFMDQAITCTFEQTDTTMFVSVEMLGQETYMRLKDKMLLAEIKEQLISLLKNLFEELKDGGEIDEFVVDI